MADDTKARLSQLRAEQHAGLLQAQNSARQAGLEQMTSNLGQPVDFSQGIPMGPPPGPAVGTSKAPVRPDVVIPRPHPSVLPKEKAMEQAQAEADAEQEQYDAEMRAAGLPVGAEVDPAQYASRPQRTQAKAPANPISRPLAANSRQVKAKKPTHSLLRQLRTEFGIGSESRPPIDVKLAEHTWTFVPLSPDMVATVSRWADSLAETAGEHRIRARQAAVCCSIIAVDGTPVWTMMGLEPAEGDDVSFPLVPKGSLRQRAALALFMELTDGMKNRLLDALVEAYLAKVDPEGSVAGYTAYEKVDHIVWVCSTEDCDHKLVRAPRQDEAAYFCEYHGTEMINISVQKPRIAEELSPLL